MDKKYAISCTTDTVSGTLTFVCMDGRRLVVTPATDYISEDVRTNCMLNGARQKLLDRAAKPRDTKTGASATPAEKMDALLATHAHMVGAAGTWCARGEGGGGAADGALLLRALIVLGERAGKTAAETTAYYSTLSAQQRAALRQHATIAPIIASLRPAPAVDTGLDGFLGQSDAAGHTADDEGSAE